MYPETGDYGDNVLRESAIDIHANTNPNPHLGANYSFCADLPDESSLKITILHDGGNYGYWLGTEVGWSVGTYDGATQTFTAHGPVYCDLEMTFYDSGEADIEVYENGSEEPTRVKSISW